VAEVPKGPRETRKMAWENENGPQVAKECHGIEGTAQKRKTRARKMS